MPHVHILDLPAAAADSPPELARLQLQAAELAGTRTIRWCRCASVRLSKIASNTGIRSPGEESSLEITEQNPAFPPF
jgi:hypothetical protein